MPAPEPPYELNVSVRLDDESGAAGLAFAADGGDKHFGFYPSAGELRLTHFEGPDVLHWTILKQKGSPYYRAGEWNKLRVQVEKDKVVCAVNGHEVFNVAAVAIPPGRVGLAKFRDTQAEFKGFALSKRLTTAEEEGALTARIDKLFADLPADGSLPTAMAADLADDVDLPTAAIVERADQLAYRAAQLRRLKEVVRQARARTELVKSLEGAEKILI